MDQINIESNVWIITEGNTPAYYIYELVSGSVSVYRNGSKVNEVSVEAGGKPVYLGIIAAMRDDRFNIASVRTESECKVVRHSIDQVWGILRNELPADIRSSIGSMIEAISIKNQIDALEDQLALMTEVKVEPPASLRDEAKSIINEIAKLYNNLIS